MSRSRPTRGVRRTRCVAALLGAALLVAAGRPASGAGVQVEPPLPIGDAARGAERASGDRLGWWRDARFGLFIHWGLYAIPAGEWKGVTVPGVSEWIMHSAQIPIAEYEPLRKQFDPVRFDAAAWATLAKRAGMRYVVITTKHHDGFSLFDSAVTDYDVAATPFGRDVMAEIAAACRGAGLRIGWYHSILDWHHPDYLPRQAWDQRPVEGARFDRYVEHLRAQVGELLGHYGPIDVMWFDGEWEQMWTSEHRRSLYDLVRTLQPSAIVNNRVDKGREGMAGLTREGAFAGDFGTPEQEVPATGLPGVDWETCLTMNDSWGFKKSDTNWKSAADLIRTLIDVASKGGNLLLNVGPTALGEIPAESVERLEAIGAWLDVHGEAIYGTTASPIGRPAWGRATQRVLRRDGSHSDSGGGVAGTAGAADGVATCVYLHVFDWPSDGVLRVSGVRGAVKRGELVARGGRKAIDVSRAGETIVLRVPAEAPDPVASVIAIEIEGAPESRSNDR